MRIAFDRNPLNLLPRLRQCVATPIKEALRPCRSAGANKSGQMHLPFCRIHTFEMSSPIQLNVLHRQRLPTEEGTSRIVTWGGGRPRSS